MVLRGLEGSFCYEFINKSNLPPQNALELPENKTLKSESAIENTLYQIYRGFISVLRKRATGFHKRAKHFELKFFIRKTLL